MGRTYGQLSLGERIDLYRLHAAGTGVRSIARQLRRCPATVSRELRRNSQSTKVWSGGYAPERAHGLALRRRRRDGRFKLARQPGLRQLVRQLLAMGWSPEQIAGRLALEQSTPGISYESIYRYIEYRSQQRDYWHQLLPRAKYRRGWRRRSRKADGRIKHRISIDKRPAYIDKRRQFGHWEADLLMFSNKQHNLLVATERTSRFTLLAKQPGKHAQPTLDRLKDWLQPLPPELRRTLTQDNGPEFAFHYQLNPAGIKTYFCHPHSPWQKGTVENTNGRIRRYIPLGTNPDTVSHDDVMALQNRLNNTPRKCLGFKTPAELFSAQLNLLHFNRESTSQPTLG